MKYHKMVPYLNSYAGFDWEVECPYDGTGPDRDCKWGEEPDEQCLREDFENGDCHPECDSDNCGSMKADITAPGCWEGRVPEECDGFYSDFGHLHPIDGKCGLMGALEIGEEDGWVWNERAMKGSYRVDGPILVTVEWDEGCAWLTPVRESANE